MANLIITIISIALVAVAALMGAYYGGAAYLSANPKAIATAYVQSMMQVAGAWKAWSVDHAGQIDAGDTAIVAWNSSATSNNPLISTYLASYPNTTNLGSNSTICPANSGFMMVVFATPTMLACLPDFRPVDGLRDSRLYTTTNYQVCDQILKIFYGSSVAISGAQLPTPVRSPFDCGWRDRNSNSTLDTGDSIEFYYKVF